jgi:sugar fermentation stimulation protein A
VSTNPGSELIEGRLIRRYKRFLADCQVPDQGEVVAHCPNSGSMKTLVDGEPRAWLRHVPDPKRKLKWTLTLLGVRRRGKALVDTGLPNQLVAEAIESGQIPRLPLNRKQKVHREIKVGEKSRLDIVIAGEERPDETNGDVYVEVKNVTMLSSVDPERADFPDAVTERGRKHLKELIRLKQMGHRAVLFLLLGRSDCSKVGFAQEIDPAYAEAILEAVSEGVEILSHRLRFRGSRIYMGEEVPIELP